MRPSVGRLQSRVRASGDGARSLRAQPRKGREGADVTDLQAVGVSSQTPDPDVTSPRVERPDVAVWAGVRRVLGGEERVNDHRLVRGTAVGLYGLHGGGGIHQRQCRQHCGTTALRPASLPSRNIRRFIVIA